MQILLYITRRLSMQSEASIINSIMSGKDSVTASKPKVHRLPAPKPRKRLFSPKYPLILSMVLLVFFALAFTAKNIDFSKAFTYKAAQNTRQLLSEASYTVTPVSEAQAALPGDRRGKMIVIQSKSGAIIGQMAKIPAESEQITEIKTVSHIDNGAGRELLSIISKY